MGWLMPLTPPLKAGFLDRYSWSDVGLVVMPEGVNLLTGYISLIIKILCASLQKLKYL